MSQATKLAVLLVMASCLLAGLWISLSTHRAVPLERPFVSESSSRPEPLNLAPLPVEVPTPSSHKKEKHTDEAAPVPIPIGEPFLTTKNAPVVLPQPDKDAIGRMHVLVLDDAAGTPVMGASIVFRGLRRVDDIGSGYAWPGEQPTAKTDRNGEAVLDYPAWVHREAPTACVNVQADHVDYAPFREDVNVRGLESRATIRLRRGTIVFVVGWVGSPTNVVRDVIPELSSHALLHPEDWVRGPDGRLCTNRLLPGPYAISVSWRSPEGVRYESHVEAFTLAEGEPAEFSLELLPAITIQGTLDPIVPRPVIDGEVIISIEFGDRHNTYRLRTYHEAIETDGSFRVRDLPPGAGQVIARCNGWCSQRIRTDVASDIGMSGSDEEGLRKALDSMAQREPDRVLVEQKFVAPSQGPIVVLMERVATLSIHAQDEAGAPLAGVTVRMSPNVFWKCGVSQVFFGRSSRALTDASGHALLEELRARPKEFLYVRMEGWHPKAGIPPRMDDLRVDLKAGETKELTVVMKRTE